MSLLLLPNDEVSENDRWGELSRKIVAFAPTLKEYTDLSAVIRSRYVNSPADTGIVAEGRMYDVLVGQKAKVKSWKSIVAVVKAVGGFREFQRLAILSFKALSGVIGNAAAEAMQVEFRTGYRTLEAVAKLPAVELLKAA